MPCFTSFAKTSIFGYASTVLSDWGLGTLVQHYGWDAGFAVLLGCAAAGTLLFMIAWPARAHGYTQELNNPIRCNRKEVPS